jgi:predicted 3-demethylubiquinone-9 3-methyltransferase (glyoxalase superfamily)
MPLACRLEQYHGEHATDAPCLWFDDQAAEAAAFYPAIFSNARIVRSSRYGEAGYEVRGKQEGTVMVAACELDGQECTALHSVTVATCTEETCTCQ